jgi:hypothetical protein
MLDRRPNFALLGPMGPIFGSDDNDNNDDPSFEKKTMGAQGQNERRLVFVVSPGKLGMIINTP